MFLFFLFCFPPVFNFSLYLSFLFSVLTITSPFISSSLPFLPNYHRHGFFPLLHILSLLSMFPFPSYLVSFNLPVISLASSSISSSLSFPCLLADYFLIFLFSSPCFYLCTRLFCFCFSITFFSSCSCLPSSPSLTCFSLHHLFLYLFPGTRTHVTIQRRRRGQ